MFDIVGGKLLLNRINISTRVRRNKNSIAVEKLGSLKKSLKRN